MSFDSEIQKIIEKFGPLTAVAVTAQIFSDVYEDWSNLEELTQSMVEYMNGVTTHLRVDGSWSATDDNYDGAPDADSPMGHAHEEDEAVADLVWQIDEFY